MKTNTSYFVIDSATTSATEIPKAIAVHHCDMKDEERQQHSTFDKYIDCSEKESA